MDSTLKYEIETTYQDIFAVSGYNDELAIQLGKKSIKVTNPNWPYDQSVVDSINRHLNEQFYKLPPCQEIETNEKWGIGDYYLNYGYRFNEGSERSTESKALRFRMNNATEFDYFYIGLSVDVNKLEDYPMKKLIDFGIDSLANFIVKNYNNWNNFIGSVYYMPWQNPNGPRVGHRLTFDSDSIGLTLATETNFEMSVPNELASSKYGSYYDPAYRYIEPKVNGMTYKSTEGKTYKTVIVDKNIYYFADWDYDSKFFKEGFIFEPPKPNTLYPIVQVFEGDSIIYEGVLDYAFEERAIDGDKIRTSIEFVAFRSQKGKLTTFQLDVAYYPAFEFVTVTDVPDPSNGDSYTRSQVNILLESGDLNGKSYYKWTDR